MASELIGWAVVDRETGKTVRNYGSSDRGKATAKKHAAALQPKDGPFRYVERFRAEPMFRGRPALAPAGTP